MDLVTALRIVVGCLVLFLFVGSPVYYLVAPGRNGRPANRTFRAVFWVGVILSALALLSGLPAMMGAFARDNNGMAYAYMTTNVAYLICGGLCGFALWRHSQVRKKQATR
jgi:high-affinity Fe2+/Pb2+ permease